MVDQILAFVVVIAPTIFALGIEVIDKRTRETTKWRVGIIVFGVALSGLTLWQQTSERRASAKERETAIKETSQQVAAETSKQVTKAVTEQYSQMVADQKKQISELQSELVAQRKDVATIKSSNIVTGKGPIPVKVMNEPPPAAAVAQVENLRMSWEPETSTHNDAPYAKKITIQADAPVNPIKLAIVCDVPIKYGEVRMVDPATMFFGGNEIYEKDAHIYIINMTTQGTALLRPDAPLVVHLYSDRPLNIVRGERGPR